MESNSSVKRHPVGYRLFIGICSICLLGTTEHIRALLIIQGKDSWRCFPLRITCKSGYNIGLKNHTSILIIPHILFCKIYFNVSITKIINAIGIGCHGIYRLSCCLCTGLNLLGKLCYLCVLVNFPSICRTIYRYRSSTCGLELSLSTYRIMRSCKLCYIIHNMLFKRRIVLYQLSFFIKLQPVLNGVSIKCYCFISKCIGDACFCKVIICIYRCLKICTVTGNIRCDICIRITAQIYFRIITADGFADHLVCFLHLQLRTLGFRHNGKFRIIKTYICILRRHLVFFLCTVQCFHLCFQLTLVKSSFFLGCVSGFSKKSLHPFIWLLRFQKFQNLTTGYIAIINI